MIRKRSGRLKSVDIVEFKRIIVSHLQGFRPLEGIRGRYLNFAVPNVYRCIVIFSRSHINSTSVVHSLQLLTPSRVTKAIADGQGTRLGEPRRD